MTDEQIRKLRELSDKATPGPWEAKEPAFAPGIGRARVFGPGYAPKHDGKECIKLEDAELIAAARNALPAILDDVDRLEAENAALQARVAVLEEVKKAALYALDRFEDYGNWRANCHFSDDDYGNPRRYFGDDENWELLEKNIRRDAAALKAALDRAGEK